MVAAQHDAPRMLMLMTAKSNASRAAATLFFKIYAPEHELA